MLGFQTERVAELVLPTALAHLGAVQIVAGVKLDTRLGGENLQHTSRPTLLDTGRKTQLAELGLVETVVVIVPTRVTGQLGDPRTDLGRLEETHHVINFQDFAGRDACVVDWGVVVGIQMHHVVENRALAGQIPVGVVGEVHRGRLVGGGEVVDPQLIVVGERVGHLHL